MNIAIDYLVILSSFFILVIFEYPRSILIPIIRQHKKVLHKEDKLSAYLIYFCDNMSWLISTGILLLNIGTLPQALFYIGIAMIAFGLFLRQWSISALGIFFAPTVRIIKAHKVIDTGPYKYIRHPSYAGALIFLFGMAIAGRSFIPIIFGMPFPIFGYLYRIHVEEKSLKNHLGKAYEAYMKKTKILIPYIF